MSMTLRAAAALATVLALTVPALATEKEASDQLANELKQEPSDKDPSAAAAHASADTQDVNKPTSDGEAKPAAEDKSKPAVQGEAAPVADDPLTTAMKAAVAGARGSDKAETSALSEFYAERQYKPLWMDGASMTAKGQSVIAEIKAAGDWALNPSDFPVPATTTAATPEEQADAELKLTTAALKYARYARGGRLDPTELTKYLDRKPPVLPPRTVLDELASTDAPEMYLRGLHPKHQQFRRLLAKYLAEVRSGPDPRTLVEIPSGPKLALGTQHPQVALLRERLDVAAPAGTDPEMYDETLMEAVKRFQSEHGAQADGIVGPATRRVLNQRESNHARRLLANLEQWRWMPEDMGRYYVWVNVPEFTIRVVDNGQVVHSERIVVGKTDTQTPIFSDMMEQVIFHPFWGVPDSIKRNELQPNLAAGGSILSRQGLRVQYRGRDIDPDAVDWAAMDMRNVHIYQPPGPSNVLGVVKFRFPNKHDVYFHDTPQKYLFKSAVRAFSHGCMRVQNPVRLAELILSHDKNMSSDRVRGLAAPGAPQDNQINLTQKIPVHITYFTAWVDDQGQVDYFRDIYGHEERIALGLEGKMHLISKVPEPKPAAPRAYGSRYDGYGRSGTPRWMRDLFDW